MGRIIHIAVDLTLFAGFLAGVKKNTGISPDITQIGQKDIEYYAIKYLDYGDYIYDSTVDFMRNSRYCTKKFFS